MTRSRISRAHRQHILLLWQELTNDLNNLELEKLHILLPKVFLNS